MRSSSGLRSGEGHPAANQEKLEALAQSLLDNEVIFKEDVQRILGERPFALPLLRLLSRRGASAEDDSASEAPKSEE